MTEIEEVLASSLINIGTPKDWQVAIMLMLKKDEQEMFSLIEWIYEKEPTFKEMMDGWLLDYLERRQI